MGSASKGNYCCAGRGGGCSDVGRHSAGWAVGHSARGATSQNQTHGDYCCVVVVFVVVVVGRRDLGRASPFNITHGRWGCEDERDILSVELWEYACDCPWCWFWSGA